MSDLDALADGRRVVTVTDDDLWWLDAVHDCAAKERMYRGEEPSPEAIASRLYDVAGSDYRPPRSVVPLLSDRPGREP